MIKSNRFDMSWLNQTMLNNVIYSNSITSNNKTRFFGDLQFKIFKRASRKCKTCFCINRLYIIS